MLRATCGKDVTKESAVFKWHQIFKEGREDVKDDAGPRVKKISSNVRKYGNGTVRSDRW